MGGSIPAGPVFARTHAIKPMVRSNEISSGISHNRYVEVLEGFNHIFAKAVLV